MKTFHKCRLKPTGPAMGIFGWLQRTIMISFDNPLAKGIFRSEAAIKQEQFRHLKISRYVIHPLSKFKICYDMYLILLYSCLLFTKAVDLAFVTQWFLKNNPTYIFWTTSTEILSWVDIFINFLTGYYQKSDNKIELQPRLIVKNYALGPYFFCDVLSAIPKALVISNVTRRTIIGRIIATALSFFAIFKTIRIVTLLKCIRQSISYLGIRSKGALDMTCVTALTVIIMHWLACIEFGIPRLCRRSLFFERNDNVWYVKVGLLQMGFWRQYLHCFFRSAAHMLSIRINLYDISLAEEYLGAIMSYMIGKVLVAFLWIIFALTILKSRSIDLKFVEKLNQLEEYLKQKRVPISLRKKICRYYDYKFQGKYFKENLVSSLLSSRLKNEVDFYVCQSFLKKVPLFNEMQSSEVNEVVKHLEPEIFMPNDVIMQCGTLGDSMYFVASGTVAVYSRSGRELAHLQDGAYFGEVSLLWDETRKVNVVALETTQVYRLRKKHFQKYMLINKEVMTKIKKTAKKKVEECMKLDDEYQKMIFELTYSNLKK